MSSLNLLSALLLAPKAEEVLDYFSYFPTLAAKLLLNESWFPLNFPNFVGCMVTFDFSDSTKDLLGLMLCLKEMALDIQIGLLPIFLLK